jgi:protocatechuate 3,4-dioxygenase beta subunit
MNSGPKILLVLAVLGAVGFALMSGLGGGGGDAPFTPVAPIETGPEEPQTGTEPVVPAEAPVQPGGDEQGSVSRSELDERSRSMEDAEQGVEGRLVDAFGVPVVDAECFLFEGHGNNLFAAMMMANRGVIQPPLAKTRSATDGSFRLGVGNPQQGKTYELRILSDRHADHTAPNLTVFQGKWYDAGTIRLNQGIVVQGRVTDAETGSAIPGATVVVKPTNSTMVLAITPGREDGIAVQTDAYGQFRVENATPGIATVAAYAPGHARVERVNQSIRAEEENRYEFELPPGKAIAGVVTEGSGTPISGARVQVLSLSSKNPVTVDTRTDRDGRFEALGLIDGPYQLLVMAQGFVRADEKPVMAGEVDKHVVMETQGSARVQASTKSGRRLNRYTVNVKTYIAQQESYGNLLHIPAMQVGPRDLDDQGFFKVSGLDPGNYALEVNAEGYAKAYTEPFQIAVGGQEPELYAKLSEGGTLTGTVLGEDGTPIQGVLVSTLPNEFEENPLADMFAPMIPYKITKSGIRTGKDGKFKLTRLTPGAYQLRFQHPEHYTIFRRDLQVEEGRVTDLPQVDMQRGTLLMGSVMVDGAPSGQIKVQVSAVQEEGAEKPNMFSATAVSDQEGRYAVPKRLPPGRYTVSAGRQANPFQMVVDYQQTKQEFTVGPGQAQHEVHFSIQTR